MKECSYPPGKFEPKNLPVFTFIHGGPANADGNHFEADSVSVGQAGGESRDGLCSNRIIAGQPDTGTSSSLASFRKSCPARARIFSPSSTHLVKDGIADPQHLTVGGYSYGGYMTNWLITQTTRFKAAVTGAGAVEHVANWGNDDTVFDDAYFLGGLAWEAPKRYYDEAAIYQINKVRTPTHVVGGGADVRVAVLEDYLLERLAHVGHSQRSSDLPRGRSFPCQESLARKNQG